MLKDAKDKYQVTFIGKPIKIITDFSTEKSNSQESLG